MPTLVARALEGTGWSIGTVDTIYENDGVTEKIRTYNCGEKTGAYTMVQEICNKFGAYPVFHGDDYKVDLWDRKKHRRMLEMQIDKNLEKMSRTRDTNDIITRLYVEGEYGDDGYVGIDDVNPTGLSFLLNFDYYREIGSLTTAQQNAIPLYTGNMYLQKTALSVATAANEANITALNTNWGSQGYVVYTVDNGSYVPTVIRGGGATAANDMAVGDTVASVAVDGSYTYREVTAVTINTPPLGEKWAIKF